MMAKVRLHTAEVDRLDALHSYGVLDTEPESSFDNLTSLAAQMCGTPMAAVTLVDRDRQWFKATVGLGITRQTPRSWSFCSDVVAAAAPLLVPDARADPRYRDNPLVIGDPGVRSYLGIPLVGRDGLPLGALCVIDTQSREFSPASQAALSALAEQVVGLLDGHRRAAGDGLLADDVLAEARQPTRLREALDAGELVAHYQPIVDIGSGRPHGLEALLRWEHPTLGVLPPSAFLPVIAASALVVPVGRAILEAAIGEIGSLRRRGLALPGGVAVNVASGQLARPGLSASVFAALDRFGVSPRSLALEITEATALPSTSLALAELNALADAGVHIVLDDYGVGWSNFARLLGLPVSAIKIDRSIAGQVLVDPRAAAVVASTVSTARELGLHVVAEGVESEQVRSRLAGLGCCWAQGWLYSPAVPGADLPRLLAYGRGQLAPLPPAGAVPAPLLAGHGR